MLYLLRTTDTGTVDGVNPPLFTRALSMALLINAAMSAI
jgi:hypothetical protein